MSVDGEGPAGRSHRRRLWSLAEKATTAWRRQDDWQLIVWTATTIVVIGVAGLLLAWLTNNLIAAGAAAGALATIAVALIQAVRKPEANWPPKVIAAVPLGSLVLALLVALAILPWRWYQSGRPVDVKAYVSLSHAESMTDGDTATAELRIIEPRPELRVVLELSNHDPAQPPCAFDSSLSVAADAGELTGQRQVDPLDAPPFHRYEEVRFGLPDGLETLGLEVLLRTGASCEMNLRVARAELLK